MRVTGIMKITVITTIGDTARHPASRPGPKTAGPLKFLIVRANLHPIL
jgi:hypothetical protein